MSYLILTITFVAIAHFVYESMIAPILRLKYRHKLFILRDQLHAIKLEDKQNKKALQVLDRAVNSFLERMNNLTISRIAELERIYKDNEAVKKNVDDMEQLFKNCSNSEIVEIDKKLQTIATKIFIVNSGGWAIYIIPVVVVALIQEKVTQGLKDFIWIPANNRDYAPNNYPQSQYAVNY